MFIEFSTNKISLEGLQQHSENLYIYIRGYIIWNNKLYQEQEFAPILINHINSNSLTGNIPNYNGCFNIIVYLNNELIVINDRWGVYPLFYYKDNLKIIISDNWEKLLPYTKKNLRKDATYEALCFGYVLGNKTLIEEIYEFAPHTYYKIFLQDKELKVHPTSYWHLQHHFNNKKRHPKEFQELWESRFKIFADHLKEKNYNAFVPLTAGLDSRLLATELDNNNIPIYAMTWGGDYKDIEIETAIKLTPNIQNLRSHSLLYLNNTTVNNMLSIDLKGNWITSLVFAKRLFYFQKLIKQECSAWFPGHSGGFMSGGHLKHRMKLWKSKEDVINYILKFQTSSTLKSVLINQSDEVKDSILTSIRRTLPVQDLISTYIRWDLEQKQRRYVIRSSISEPRELMNLYLPYYDYEIMDFFLNLPFSQLINKNLKIKAMSKYIYKNKPAIRKIKNNGKPLRPIRNNLLYEYENKLIKKLKEITGINNKKEYSNDFDWENIKISITLPEFLYQNIPNKIDQNKKLHHFYNLSCLYKKIN